MSQYDTRHPTHDFMSSSSSTSTSNLEHGKDRDILYSALNLHKDNNDNNENNDNNDNNDNNATTSSSHHHHHHHLFNNNRSSASNRWPVVVSQHPGSSSLSNHHHGNNGTNGNSSRSSSCLSPSIFAHQPNLDLAPTNRSPRTLYPPGGPPPPPGQGTSGPLHPGMTAADRRSSPLALLATSDGGSALGTRKGPGVGRIKSYHCRMCDQEFQCKSEMQQHSKNVHRLEDKGHKCTKCFKSFPSSQQLAQHLLVHTNVRKYLCRFCDKAFKQLSHVQQHQRIHTGERPYKCAVESCAKAFRQLSSLQQHLKGHNILNSNRLTKSYPVSRNSSIPRLQTTMIVNQLPSDLARPHDLTCQVCEKHCADEIRFFHHIHKHHADYWRVFSGGRPLSDFIESRGELKRREKPYKCAVCSKCYSHENGYVKHLATHPDSLPDVRMQLFSCAVCDKFFTKEAYLLRHMEMKLDEMHCVGLQQLKKNNPMFRSGVGGDTTAVSATTALYSMDQAGGLGRGVGDMATMGGDSGSHCFQNGATDTSYSTATTFTSSNNNNSQALLSPSSADLAGPSSRSLHLRSPYLHRHHALSTGDMAAATTAHHPYLQGPSVSSSRPDVVQLKLDPGSPGAAAAPHPPSSANRGPITTNPRSVSHMMLDVGSPGSTASDSSSPSHFNFPSEHHPGFDGLPQTRNLLRAHDHSQYPLRMQQLSPPGRRSELCSPAATTFGGKALNSGGGGDQVGQGPYYTQPYPQSPRTHHHHLSRYLADPLHCSTEENGCYFSSPFPYLPHFQGLPTTASSVPSNSLPGRMSPRPFVHPSIVPFPYTLAYRSHT